MLNPDERQLQAIRGLAAAAPRFFDEYINYLKAVREYEREGMENSAPEHTEVAKGKCRMLTEEINNLKSLVPKGGD